MSIEEIHQKLRSATFRMCIPEGDQVYWGTGFFISEDGLALTAHHNIPQSIRRQGYGSVDVYYRNPNKPLPLWWRADISSKETDIAVLELQASGQAPVDYLRAAYLKSDVSPQDRHRNWAGRMVCIYGFPCEQGAEGERRVDGLIDSGQPLAWVDEHDEDDNPIRIERLRILGNRGEELSGISGGPVLDRELGLVIGVDGSALRPMSYRTWVYASELSRLVEGWPQELKQRAQQLPLTSGLMAGADPALLEEAYLRRVMKECNALPLAVIDPRFAGETDNRTMDLSAVYVALDTQMQVGGEVPEESSGWVRKDKSIVHRQRKSRPLAALEAAALERQLVLLGSPGSGKSTFANFLALCLASERLEKGGNWLARIQPAWPHGALLPLRVTLREFAATDDCDGTAAGLWDFISEDLRKKGLDDFAPHLHRHLLTGGVMVILDGLDEVGDPATRITVRKAVSDFAATHGTTENRFLVTCRTYAYQEPGSQLDQFTACTLAPLNGGQIEDFIQYWHQEMGEKGFRSPTEAEDLARRLQAAVCRPDLMPLSQSPLQLTMMATLHFSWGRLPEDRTELYQEMVKLLLVRWQEARLGERGGVTRRVRADCLEKQLELAAFKAHSAQDALQGAADIREGELREVLQACTKGSWDKAGELLTFIKERAGLLLEKAPGVYTFPHRSYQEYLAGSHLASQRKFPAEVKRLVRENYAHWREVVLWAAGIIARLRKMAWQTVHVAEVLCPREGSVSADDWRAAWLAGEALMEVPADELTAEEHDRNVLIMVRRRLVALLEAGALAPKERAAVGDVVAKLGDPRFREDAWYLPDEPLLGFVEIPAGPFLMGSDKKKDREASDDEFPQHTVELPTYYIGRFPVTVAQFRVFVEQSGHKPKEPDCLKGVSNHPIVNVTWYDTMEYCNWLTERLRAWRGTPEPLATLLRQGELGAGQWRVTLPSEAEWEKAARGGDGRAYPWGKEADPNLANYDATGIGTTSAVGSFLGGASPYGCLDMAGNVWEWTRNLYRSYPFDPKDGREDLKAGSDVPRVLRGGSFNFRGYVRCADRYGIVPDLRGWIDGFRVVLSQDTLNSD